MTLISILFISTTLLLITYIATHTLPTNTRSREEKFEIETTPYAAWSIALLAISAITFSLLTITKTKLETDIGIIGDFFGGVLNPTFSLITIFILLRVSKLQSIEFRKNTDSLQHQKETYTLEKFENTLFKLTDQLEKHAENFDTIKIELPDGSIKTKSKRENLTKRLWDLSTQSHFKNAPTRKKYALIKEAIEKETKTASDQNIAMIKRLCLTIDHIEKSSLTKDRKKFYYALINASIPIRTIYLVSMYAIPYKGKTAPRKKIKLSGLAKPVKEELFYIDLIKKYYK